MKINYAALLTKWRTALLCGAIYFHHLGMQRIVSFLFVGTTERYDVDRNKASFPYFLRMTVAGLMGPIVGYLGCIFRLEHIIMLGCLLSALGIALCFIAESILMVTLCWGLLLGVGTGLTLATTTFLNWHYKNDVSVANGISFVGASIGGIVYTIISKTFMDKYHLSGTFLLISALSLHSVPAVMLLTDPRFPQETLNRKRDFKNESAEKNENWQKVTHQKNIFGPNVVCKNEDCVEHKTGIYLKSFTNILPSHMDQMQTSEILYTEVDKQKPYLYDCRLPINNVLQDIPKQTLTTQTENRTSLHRGLREFNTEGLSEAIYQKENSVGEFLSKSRKEDAFMDFKDVSLSETPIQKQEKKSWKSFRLLYEPLFILISFLQSSSMGFLILLTTTTGDLVVDKGFTMNDAAVLLVSGYVSELIGRVCFGWVTDNGFMSVSNFIATLHVALGICFVAFALNTEMIGLTISYFMGSLAIGGLMPMYAALISENFEGDLKTMALSSRFFLFLPISFIFPLIIGYFRDHQGSYLGLYFSMAGYCGVCAVMLLLLPSLSKCRNIQQKTSVSN